MFNRPKSVENQGWVKETRFGKWFLSSDVWFRYVLSEAVADLNALLNDRRPLAGSILDAGCGQGLAFRLLEKSYQPKRIVGLDIDATLVDIAAKTLAQRSASIELITASVTQLPYPDECFDAIFSHQLLHHVSNQAGVLKEYYRVLSPGGLLLSCESCRSFIESYPVRVLFRHPMQAQKTAEEYVELIRSIGFQLDDRDIKMFTPWWSENDFGVMRKLGLREVSELIPTEVVMVASKP